MSPGAAFEAAARRLRPARSPAPWPGRAGLQVVPGRATRAPRAPFVVLVLLVLGVGLVGLLLLNTALQQGSFELRNAEREMRDLRAQEAALVQEVSRLAAPDELARRAAALGMEPATAWTFLTLGGGDE